MVNNGQSSAMFVWLEDGRAVNTPGYAYFDDNYFCLLPGEERNITAKWKDVPVNGRKIEISGWNMESLLFEVSMQ